LQLKIRKYLESIEKDNDLKLPSDFIDTAVNSEIIDAFCKKDKKKILELFNPGIELLEMLTGSGLKEHGKNTVRKLIDDIYNYTNDEGLGNRLWKYMNQILFVVSAVDNLDKITKNKIGQKDVYLILSLYSQIFEITLQIVAEICAIIAEKKSCENNCSKVFYEYYRKATNEGKFPSRYRVIEFLREEGYVKNDEKFILDDASLRNKFSHASIYYDEKKKLVFVGNKSYTLKEIRSKLQEFYELLSFIVYYVLEKKNVIPSIKAIKEKGLENLDRIDFTKL